MPTVGVRGQPGYEDFAYTPEGIAAARAYARETGLTLHDESAAKGGPQRSKPLDRSKLKRSAGKVNIPTPSTKRY